VFQDNKYRVVAVVLVFLIAETSNNETEHEKHIPCLAVVVKFDGHVCHIESVTKAIYYKEIKLCFLCRCYTTPFSRNCVIHKSYC